MADKNSPLKCPGEHDQWTTWGAMCWRCDVCGFEVVWDVDDDLTEHWQQRALKAEARVAERGNNVEILRGALDKAVRQGALARVALRPFREYARCLQPSERHLPNWHILATREPTQQENESRVRHITVGDLRGLITLKDEEDES